MIKYSTSHAICLSCNQRILSLEEKVSYEDYLCKIAEAEVVWSDQMEAMKAREDSLRNSGMSLQEMRELVDELFRKHRETLNLQTTDETA